MQQEEEAQKEEEEEGLTGPLDEMPIMYERSAQNISSGGCVPICRPTATTRRCPLPTPLPSAEHGTLSTPPLHPL